MCQLINIKYATVDKLKLELGAHILWISSTHEYYSSPKYEHLTPIINLSTVAFSIFFNRHIVSHQKNTCLYRRRLPPSGVVHVGQVLSFGISPKSASRLLPDGLVEIKITGCRCYFWAFQLELDILGTKNIGIGSVDAKLQQQSLF